MSSVKKTLLAGVSAIFIAGPAFAADMPPPVVYQPVPIPVQKEFDGWYLRGDIGITNQQVKSLENTSFASASGFRFIDEPAFDSGIMFGLGIGYQYNDWLRFDLTGEYRGKTRFTALDTYTFGGTVYTNDYTARKSEWLFLANAYIDLGTWWCITPFIGAGIGFADVKISAFRDINVIAGGGGYAKDESKQNFAWALHAGLAYNVSKTFAVEFGYRYLNLGDGLSGDLINLDGTNATNNPMTFKDITSHDFKVGLRWTCCDDSATRKVPAMGPAAPIYMPAPQPALAAPPPAPVYVQPQYGPPPPPVYTQPQYAPSPPPGYTQPQYAPPPPLSRRG